MPLLATKREISSERGIKPRQSAPDQLTTYVQIANQDARNNATMPVDIARNEPQLSVSQQVDESELRFPPIRLIAFGCVDVGQSDLNFSPVDPHKDAVAVCDPSKWTFQETIRPRAVVATALIARFEAIQRVRFDAFEVRGKRLRERFARRRDETHGPEEPV